MKNLLVISLFLASTVSTYAQTAPNDTLYAFADEMGALPLPLDSSNVAKPIEENFTALHITVLDLITQIPINTKIDFFYNSDFIKSDSGVTELGQLQTQLENIGYYYISVSAPGYFDLTDTIWVVSETRKSIHKLFNMVAIEVGVSHTLANINFNFGKTSLSEESFVILNKEILFLNQNPTTFFEISGHTDSDGSQDYNLLLSQGRAQTVVDYLVSNGANREQLSAHGYGETRPLNNNKTKASKATNRRVELKVLSTELVLNKL